MSKLRSGCGQALTNNMQVAVLYAVLPKDMQERVFDECAANWGETTEKEAGRRFSKEGDESDDAEVMYIRGKGLETSERILRNPTVRGSRVGKAECR